MTQKIYIVEGRQFQTAAEYNRAIHDKKIIDKLKPQLEQFTVGQLKQLKQELENGKKVKFQTALGQDFLAEMEKLIQKKQQGGESGRNVRRTAKQQKELTLDEIVTEELYRQEKKRKRKILCCGLIAALCLGYVGIYTYHDYRTTDTYEQLSALKDKPVSEEVNQLLEKTPTFTLDEEKEIPEVLEEYKNLLIKNKKLIGWVKIADTNIDYPVMQTSDNEYYLDHNLNQEYDKNGSIFMDKDCDVLKPSTNFILYGHHMKNGKMFGKLHLYSEESYYEKHPYIEFDTIYEKGTYQVMYAFRSRVYSEEEIVFKYYQFIEAYSEQEFDSYMQEMAAMSFYDTGVTASYGDQLLTLSTCDYQEKDGRFVVVAKKID